MERKAGEVGSLTERELEKLLSRVPFWQGKVISYQPTFGGFSNSNWKVRVGDDHKSFFVKLPGAGTENFIDRSASLEASQRAYLLGIGPRPYDYLADKGVEICDFVDGCRPARCGSFTHPKSEIGQSIAFAHSTIPPRSSSPRPSSA